MMTFAIVALVATATVSLVLPLAVRKVVDNFNVDESNLLDQYFAMAILVVALLAFGTGMRYALVTRLGERVVTDIRKAVFGRVINMSPAFYDNILTGEVLSRITTDTTLILSVIGASVSIALRNMLIFAGGLTMLLLTSVKLTGLLLLIVPIVALPISKPSLVEERLFDEEFVLVRALADADRPVPSPDTLRAMRLLLLEEGHCFRDQALSYCNTAASLPRDLMEGSSLTTLVQMVGAGIGVTLIPEMALTIETRSAPVSTARLAAPRPSRTIDMIWRKSNPLASQFGQITDSIRQASVIR